MKNLLNVCFVLVCSLLLFGCGSVSSGGSSDDNAAAGVLSVAVSQSDYDNLSIAGDIFSIVNGYVCESYLHAISGPSNLVSFSFLEPMLKNSLNIGGTFDVNGLGSHKLLLSGSVPSVNFSMNADCISGVNASSFITKLYGGMSLNYLATNNMSLTVDNFLYETAVDFLTLVSDIKYVYPVNFNVATHNYGIDFLLDICAETSLSTGKFVSGNYDLAGTVYKEGAAIGSLFMDNAGTPGILNSDDDILCIKDLSGSVVATCNIDICL